MEIVENVLLVEEPSGVVPGLAVFAAAPQVGQHEVAEMLGEEQTCDPEAEKELLLGAKAFNKTDFR